MLGSKTGANVLTGNGSDNELTGGDGKDTLSGLLGKDKLTGGSGDDILLGGNEDDTLNGDGGIDRLTGGTGKDTMNGGSGADLFIFGQSDFSGIASATADYLGDFRPSEGDKINLELVDANVFTDKNDPFIFIGTAEFSGVRGELRYFSYSVGLAGDAFERLVLGDTNGDKIADFAIRLGSLASLFNPTTLFATDFVL